MTNQIKLSPMQWLKIIGAVVKAIKRIGEEVKAAKDPDSDGGKRITPPEAWAIAQAALDEAVEPVAAILIEA